MDQGFDFLGFTIRRYSGKTLLATPAKAKILAYIKRIKDLLSKHKQATQTGVICSLNPIIGGWSNYYHNGNSKKTFSYVDHRVWELVWRWAKRRHPNKSNHWVKYKYFPGQDWIFRNDSVRLYRHKHTPIIRHIKVRGNQSPLNPDSREYWEQRCRRRQLKESFYKERREALFRQQNSCALCGAPFLHGDPLHDKNAVYLSLEAPPANRQLVHSWCRIAQRV
ncbi:group II intron maturase-specific domain-containing protein [Endozoicomonas sp. 4G]|uniref:group II intron maturase-specific domain-containing protein n=1 Tax=Endozoicomonas sp. 4G TaxID=2872754 RepID=UPI0021112F51|nr:group II intron maturase-specific domain-containing protein [Endozoicomonas sp. 4G]